ncbi:MAG: hypothetical protein JSS62_01525 [Verrucomicrobia bacterium]|nr:hypothetical protein [Verrucomicrobiota bacterium]
MFNVGGICIRPIQKQDTVEIFEMTSKNKELGPGHRVHHRLAVYSSCEHSLAKLLKWRLCELCGFFTSINTLKINRIHKLIDKPINLWFF